MAVELSERLAAVARQVPAGAVVADIGTDHAYLPVYLVRRGIAPRAVAGDVHRKPYEAALATVRACELEDRIDVRLGDGLQVLAPGEADVVVLAGMGGKTVCSILTAGRSVLAKVQRLIIQPMRDISLVRRWLLANGWRLADEDMAREGGHYYFIMAAEPGQEKVKDAFWLELGPRLLEKRHELLHDYLLKRLREIDTVLAEIKRAQSAVALEKAALLKQEAEKIREVFSKW